MPYCFIAMWDIAGNKTVRHLLEAFNSENKPVGLVGHGVAGLLSLQNENGELLIKGKQLTGFSNSEEESAGLTKTVPFLLETRLITLGALYTKGPNYLSHVVIDGNIITGQNPSSSEGVAKKTIALLQEAKQKPLLQAEHETVWIPPFNEFTPGIRVAKAPSIAVVIKCPGWQDYQDSCFHKPFRKKSVYYVTLLQNHVTQLPFHRPNFILNFFVSLLV